jgi:hypothetical protein
MGGAVLVQSIQSHCSVFRGRQGEPERIVVGVEGEEDIGEEGGVGSFFMLTRIIAVRSITEDSSLSIWWCSIGIVGWLSAIIIKKVRGRMRIVLLCALLSAE